MLIYDDTYTKRSQLSHESWLQPLANHLAHVCNGIACD